MIGNEKELVVIGVCGAIGAGKDTVANILVDKFGFKRVAFADKLKEACRIIYSFSDEQLYGTQAQKEAIDPYWGASSRSLMQRTGTQALRHVIDSDIWVKALMQTLLQSGGGRYVISDCRFENEVKMIHLLGGVLWNVERVKLTRRERFINRVKDFFGITHESERLWHNLDLADCIIDNTGTMEALEKNIGIRLYRNDLYRACTAHGFK